MKSDLHLNFPFARSERKDGMVNKYLRTDVSSLQNVLQGVAVIGIITVREDSDGSRTSFTIFSSFAVRLVSFCFALQKRLCRCGVGHDSKADFLLPRAIGRV